MAADKSQINSNKHMLIITRTWIKSESYGYKSDGYCLNVMPELASKNWAKVNKRSWNLVGSLEKPPRVVCSMTLTPARFEQMFG